MSTRTGPRVVFALTVMAGNRTRFATLRDYLREGHPFSSVRMVPIRTWVEDEPILARFPAFIRLRMRQLLDSLPMLRFWSYDVVVTQAWETTYLLLLFKRLLRIKTAVVVTSDAGLPGMAEAGRWKALKRWLLQGVDVFVPWSEFAARQMRLQAPAIPDARMHVLHPGIDLREWPVRVHAPLPDAPYTLLFVGGDLRRKGIGTVLDALESELLAGCVLNVATQSGWLDYERELRERLERHPQVRLFIDLQPGSDELKQLYQTANVFVLPTTRDASPWVTFEAMASGLPVVTCETGAIGEAIEHGVTGLLVPPDDAQALATAVSQLRGDLHMADAVAKAARLKVEARYDLASNTAKLNELICSLAQRQTQPAITPTELLPEGERD